MSSGILFIRIAILLQQVILTEGLQCLSIPWSYRHYGPDGPWHAVSVRVGGFDNGTLPERQSTAVDLLPGGQWGSYVLSPIACAEYPENRCLDSGVWTPPSGSGGKPIEVRARSVNRAAGISYSGSNLPQMTYVVPTSGPAVSVYSTSLVQVLWGNVTYPNGAVGPPVIGSFGLGATNEVNVTFTTTGDGSLESKPESARLFPSGLWENGVIPSYTYGLHIGSVRFIYPGSLTFGGFDRGRIVGAYATYQLAAASPDTNSTVAEAGPQLLDIIIGVEEGRYPFPFARQDRLLRSDSSQDGVYEAGGVMVQIDPIAPYLHLSTQTCKAIAALLPLIYDESLRYWLWNTDDPLFERIVRSPAYLGFIFASGGAFLSNITIKVPFALLNLTLDSPITPLPVPYFPCQPYDRHPPGTSADNYRLGRAFLQSAFVGANWMRGIGWLGQAPGPGSAGQGLGLAVTDLAETDIDLPGVDKSEDLFANSWAAHWTVTPLPEDSDNGKIKPYPNSASTGGLPTAAWIGIGVGIGLLVLLSTSGVLIFWKRMINRSVSGSGFDQPRSADPNANAASGSSGYAFEKAELSCTELAEMLVSSPKELDSHKAACHELPNSNHIPAELEASGRHRSRGFF